MEKKRKITLSEAQGASIRTDLPAAWDEEVVSEAQGASIRTELPVAPDEEIHVPFRPPQIDLELPAAPDLAENRRQFFFSGEWIPDRDPLQIGEENYSELQNLRYRNVGLEAVQGYDKINTTAIPVYLKIRSAIQIVTPHTIPGYVLAHGENAAENASAIIKNITAIPNQGDFAATPIWTDDVAAGAGLGRFARWPAGEMGYCNGIETMIWAGNEHRLGAFIGASGVGASMEHATDKTKELQNILDDSSNIFTIDTAATLDHFIVGAIRPLKGAKVYIKTPNPQASVLTVRHFTGAAWGAVGGLSDGTSVGGKSLAQTGMVEWTSGVGVSKVKFLEERLLYWYDFSIDAGSAAIYHATINAPPQDLNDIWDGIYRPVVQCQQLHAQEGWWVDYTMEMITQTPAGWFAVHTLKEDGTPSPAYYYPGYYMNVHDLSATIPILAGFEERICGLRVTMLRTNIESNASDINIEYYNGQDWQIVTGLVDRTKKNGRPLGISGVISWTPPDDEVAKEEFGVKAYYYRITANPSLWKREGQHIWIDLIQGITSPRYLSAAYKFPFMFQNRAMICGYIGGKQGNRVDYAMMHAPSVWNGEDSSDGPAGPLYFGTGEELMAACEIYNRFGSSVYNTAIFCKKNETYLLNGYNAQTWRIYPVSKTVGCPAPLTMDTAEVGFGIEEDAIRNIAIWLSYDGPVIFDAGVLIPIKDRIRCYFDKQDARCINYSAIEKACGWVDPDKQEYNLNIPSGTGQTTNNVLLVLDLVRKRWFQKIPTAASNPHLQGAMRVVDSDGAQYVYGFRDNGYMMRLETGTTWDGAAIAQKVVTADQIVSKDIWDETEIRRVKFACESVAEMVRVAIKHYKNGETVPTSLNSVGATGPERYVRDTQGCNLPGWSHKFEFAASTRSEQKGVPLLGWGYTFKKIRQDD